jgi:hypothetical protein
MTQTDDDHDEDDAGERWRSSARAVAAPDRLPNEADTTREFRDSAAPFT